MAPVPGPTPTMAPCLTTTPPAPWPLAAPDAFKGTAGAPALAAAMARGARRAGWDCDPCPLSDGGEGFADVLAQQALALGGLRPGSWHRDPRSPARSGAPWSPRWWMAEGVAVVESAAASGLPLAGGRRGQRPAAAPPPGAQASSWWRPWRPGPGGSCVGVGGSATTDGGRGALEAIEDAGGLGGAEVVVACDVETRFVDAAEQFGPQKGATPAQVVELRDRLAALVVELRERYGVDVAAASRARAPPEASPAVWPPSGRGSSPASGWWRSPSGLLDRLAGADLVVTGEGRLDASSWSGKVVGGVVRCRPRRRGPGARRGRGRGPRGRDDGHRGLEGPGYVAVEVLQPDRPLRRGPGHGQIPPDVWRTWWPSALGELVRGEGAPLDK